MLLINSMAGVKHAKVCYSKTTVNGSSMFSRGKILKSQCNSMSSTRELRNSS